MNKDIENLHTLIRIVTVFTTILLFTDYYKIGLAYNIVLFSAQIYFKGCVLDTGERGMIMDRFSPNKYVQMWLTLLVVLVNVYFLIK